MSKILNTCRYCKETIELVADQWRHEYGSTSRHTPMPETQACLVTQPTPAAPAVIVNVVDYTNLNKALAENPDLVINAVKNNPEIAHAMGYSMPAPAQKAPPIEQHAKKRNPRPPTQEPEPEERTMTQADKMYAESIARDHFLERKGICPPKGFSRGQVMAYKKAFFIAQLHHHMDVFRDAAVRALKAEFHMTDQEIALAKHR